MTKCEECHKAEGDRETMVDGWKKPKRLCGACRRAALVQYVEAGPEPVPTEAAANAPDMEQ